MPELPYDRRDEFAALLAKLPQEHQITRKILQDLLHGDPSEETRWTHILMALYGINELERRVLALERAASTGTA